MHFAAKLALASFVPVSFLAAKAWLCGPCCTGSAAASQNATVTGRYVEARSASVFAGACHFGAEATTQGREAVLAWQLSGGEIDGVSLAGVEIVAAVRAQANLAEAGAARSSVVYLEEELPEATRRAALTWLQREHAGVLGQVLEVKTGAVEVDCDGERYSVNALDLVRLEGAALPDRACCSMPANVWYAPLVELEGRIVGESELFALSDPDLGPAFERRSENDAFLGAIGPSGSGCERSAQDPSCCPPTESAAASS